MKQWLSTKVGFPLVLSGPSGVGKTSIAARLLEHDPLCVRSVSATTRAMREGEVEGESYFFVGEERFLQLRDQGGLAESARYADAWYGTPKEALDNKLDQGFCVILNIEVQGGLQLREAYPGAVLVFVIPPSWGELRHRLQGRGTDARAIVNVRIRRAHEELEEVSRYDYVIVNDELKRCTSDLEAIVRSERRRTARLWQPRMEEG